MQRLGIIGLLKIELPAYTLRLCDGGFVHWDGETYRSKDPVFGTIAALGNLTEGFAASVPTFDMTLLPTADAAASELSQPGFQRSRVRFWLAEYAPDDGMLIGDPVLKFLGQIDQTTLGEDGATREVEMAVVSLLERLLFRNRGNSLNPRFQDSVWPGETGHDNANGLGRARAWGVESPSGGNGSARGSAIGGGFVDDFGRLAA